jgi:integrase/recombinase XerD
MGTVSWTRGRGPLVPFVVACQRDGTSGLPRPRDHRVWSVSMVISLLLVNWHAGVGVCFCTVVGFLSSSVGVAFDDEFVGGFHRELLEAGHPPAGAKHYLKLMGQLDRWLAAGDRQVGDLTPEVAEEFLAAHRARGQRRMPTLASLAQLFEYLRHQEAVRAPRSKPPTAREMLLADYRRHLVDDRGLTPTTVVRYERFARRFLAHRAEGHGVEIGTENLASSEISAFMLEASSRLVVESAKRETADLRALLRFLYLRGVVDTDLGTAMPPVAVWRGTRLPSTLSAMADFPARDVRRP